MLLSNVTSDNKSSWTQLINHYGIESKKNHCNFIPNMGNSLIPVTSGLFLVLVTRAQRAAKKSLRSTTKLHRNVRNSLNYLMNAYSSSSRLSLFLFTVFFFSCVSFYIFFQSSNPSSLYRWFSLAEMSILENFLVWITQARVSLNFITNRFVYY